MAVAEDLTGRLYDLASKTPDCGAGWAFTLTCDVLEMCVLLLLLAFVTLPACLTLPRRIAPCCVVVHSVDLPGVAHSVARCAINKLTVMAAIIEEKNCSQPRGPSS